MENLEAQVEFVVSSADRRPHEPIATFPLHLGARSHTSARPIIWYRCECYVILLKRSRRFLTWNSSAVITQERTTIRCLGAWF